MEQGKTSSSTPSTASSSVGMTSTQCVENVSKDQDFITIPEDGEEAKKPEEKEKPAKKQKVLTSAVWTHFDRIESIKEGTKKVTALCKYCHTPFNGASNQGTTHLKNHIDKCRMRLVKVPVSQMLLGKKLSNEDSRPKLGVHKFDVATERELFAKMVAKHDLPFLMAEYDYFRLWISYIMPSYKHRGRKTVKSDLVSVYAAEKERIYKEIYKEIQKTARYIALSPQRDEKFTLALSQTKLNTRRRIPLDVDNRWNSTYEMIVASLELRPAIDRLQELDPEYKHLPSEIEWENGKNLCDCLKIFSDITKKHSAVKYPTANLYFIDVVQIRRSIKTWLESSDDWICLMASKMKLKFDKYWEECNMLLTVAVILDPRYKMHIVTYAYKGMYDLRADFYIDGMREFLDQIFNEYSEKFGTNKGFVESSGNASSASASSVGGEWLGGFQDFIASSNSMGNTRKSELEEYLKEGLFPTENEVEFDILQWWKHNGPKFPILARMAQDILAIPTSSVASENSFSKCRRIITDTRSSLNDDSVETLMCVKDWLPDINEGQSGPSGKLKAVDDETSDFASNEWDVDF